MTEPDDPGRPRGDEEPRRPRIEPVEEIVEAIRRASRYVPLERLHVNPSCGLDYLPRQSAYNKLVRLVEGANRAREVLR